MGSQRWTNPTCHRSLRDTAAQIEREGGKPWRPIGGPWNRVVTVPPPVWGYTGDPKKLLRAAWRARALFEELMSIEDGTREWEHLEPRVRAALDRVVVMLGGRARKP